MGMVEIRRRLAFSPMTTTSFFLLLSLPLLYLALFRSDAIPSVSWKNQISSWSTSGVHAGTTTTSINNKVIIAAEEDNIKFFLRRLVRGRDRTAFDNTGFACHSGFQAGGKKSGFQYDVCVSKKPVRIDTRSMTVYLLSNQTLLPSIRRTVWPYGIKYENPMQNVAPVVILRGSDPNPPPCDITHNVSALIFSSGGFSGNMFHEFNDIIIPLFLTSHHFQSYVQFIVTDFRPWWVSKYHGILTHLSRYDVINPGEDGRVHCFPGAVVGLEYHDNLSCNTTDIPGGYSITDFRSFLRNSFNLKVKKVPEIDNEPVLILISRQYSRMFLNEDEMVTVAKELGFKVVVASSDRDRIDDLNEFAVVINSGSVLVGAHGSGLTNVLFLAEGAVMVQVVPLGLDWASTALFGDPARAMGIHYLEYKISPEESSLLEKYGRDHPVISDPMSIHKQGYDVGRAVYVDGQNLRPNLQRFRETLVEALKLLRSSSPEEIIE